MRKTIVSEFMTLDGVTQAPFSIWNSWKASHTLPMLSIWYIVL